MLINIPSLSNQTDADANDINSRFAIVQNAINGNIDTSNLSDSAVTTSKLANESVINTKIAPGTIVASRLNTSWVGTSTAKSNQGTTSTTVFNKTIELLEACRIYVIYATRANANTTSVDPSVQILINDVIATSYTGSGGLELLTAKTNADYPVTVAGVSNTTYSGTVTIKIRLDSNVNNGWDAAAGSVRIDAIAANNFLG